MTDATELDLDAIRARLDAATEGPWRVDEIARVWADRDPAGWDAFHIAACHDAVGRAGHDDEANAEFIAHARTDVERLLAKVGRLTWLLRAAAEADAREDCQLDHNGGCQMHGWLGEDTPCPFPEIRAALVTTPPD